MGVGVVDVHDTNMGFKPPCHFVIVHIRFTYVFVILEAYLVELHLHFDESLVFVSMVSRTKLPTKRKCNSIRYYSKMTIT